MPKDSGVKFQDSNAVTVNVCVECQSSLLKNKVPQLALANQLYRGSLPDRFSDLMWVEEKVCALYLITAHSSDPTQPRVFHGNTCAHEMNTVSTASVLPRMPSDVNGFLSVIFIGPEQFDPSRLRTFFRVRKHKIWSFLVWLKHHNALYASIPLDASIMDLYPSDGPLPGLTERV
ncbi:hypothetical protein DFJ58DRAFT_712827 [Suillus subalutaceus]|uniref:uncharacterized protein n=1 Tax=Suillus subalutaceus TaxID=48586 RepID=UPI001B8630C6|nr:uncharacterized protein DFJ58DRAFT_712827 [Suillus subalutaceus]KAG1876577.1 hypothetical protein DFJ58DRAFT_712827 [Suillus subalutaceus]